MESNHTGAWGVAAALVLTGLLAAGPSQAQSCLTGAKTTEKASSSKRNYDYVSAGHAVNAAGVVWKDIKDHVVRIEGDDTACWSGGYVDGPYPENAVYECSSTHGYTGGTCWDYHYTAGIALEVDAPLTVIEDLRISEYGDGVSLESSSGDVIVRRSYLHDLHDDAVENDWGKNVTVSDTLIERTFIAFAARPRSSSSIDQRNKTFTVRNNLVLLHRFTNSYKQKPGHGGFFKWPNDGTGPQFIVTDNVFVMDKPGSGQLTLPLVDQLAECRNNKLLWAGSVSAYNNWLDDGDGESDGMRDNEARLKALSNCYTVVVKPDSQSKAAFLAQHWDPLVTQWKSTHAAAGGTNSNPPPPPPPDPGPVPGAPQEPILLP